VLALLDAIHAKRGNEKRPSLVVAPKSLVFHWIDEARRFAPRLTVLEWHGAAREQAAKRFGEVDLVVTTYATLRRDLDRFAKQPFELVILDEAQAIKNAKSQVAAACLELRAELRLALTGTPIENRLDDLASIFDFLNPGLLGRAGILRELGAAAGELEQARVLGRLLRPFLLRRTKDEVLAELPPKTEQLLTCRLEGKQRKQYDDLRRHYRDALLPQVERDGVGRSAIVVLEALLRLRQAALHPGLLDAGRGDEPSAKLDVLVEQLQEVVASGHRALVFSQFTSLLAIVQRRLEREGIAFEYLDGQTADRRERVAAFQAGSAPVFLLSLKAGGSGLNLTRADHVFLLDPWWNPAVEAQAIDRVHRIGQDRPVTAYRLVAEDTVEAKILALQDHKRALFANVFENKGVLARMSAADIKALLD
jgi:SNF2 family DNA or RNA helicase